MRERIRSFIRSNRCLCIFSVMQMTLMLSMLEVKIQVEKSAELQRSVTRVYLVAKPRDLACSPLYSVFAMGALFYGYGLIYLRTKGSPGGFLSRLRSSGLSVWQRSSPVMLLPWCMKVLQGLALFPLHLWECLRKESCLGADHFLLFAIVAVLFWNYQMVLAIASFVAAVGLNLRMQGARYIRNRNHELRAYAQGINALLGFEMIVNA
ncbi:uncharacterized protein LOC108100087 [Drosophila ficusphila]|uniref:uncharacterized protein LOC108100087 n=1 Tax=Drosophila ficusphila TaxID=30025 RepID=UPI0007E6C14F|nr:uncharacterized protein LOC108100087 [Drosophila ficusphila]